MVRLIDMPNTTNMVALRVETDVNYEDVVGVGDRPSVEDGQ